MADPVRLGPITVTVEGQRNQIVVSEEEPSTVLVGGSSGSTSYLDQLINFSLSNLLTVTTGKTKFVFPVPAVLLGVTPSVNTAPVGSDVIIDVNINGVSTFAPANRPRVLDGQEVGAEATTFLDATVEAGDYLTVDVDQVGSSTPGDFLGVTVRYRLV